MVLRLMLSAWMWDQGVLVMMDPRLQDLMSRAVNPLRVRCQSSCIPLSLRDNDTAGLHSAQPDVAQIEDTEAAMVPEDEVAAAAARVIEKLEVRLCVSYSSTV